MVWYGMRGEWVSTFIVVAFQGAGGECGGTFIFFGEVPAGGRDETEFVELFCFGGLWDGVLEFVDVVLAAETLVTEDERCYDCAGSNCRTDQLRCAKVVWAKRWHGYR